MGSFQAKIYLDSELITTIEIKNDTPLSEIKTKCNSYFHEDSHHYYFISKEGNTIRNIYFITAKDVVQKDSNGYKIKIISEQYSFNANIYIDSQLIENIKVKKDTKLSEIRKKCQSNFKEDEEYYFISTSGNILKNDSDFTVEKVWKEERNKEYKIEIKAEKVKYRVNIYIDDNFETFIYITKDTKLNKIRELCQSYFQGDKNYYFILEDNVMIKNDSNYIAKHILKRDNNAYKIHIKTEDICIRITVYLNGLKKESILCNYSMSLKDVKNKLDEDIDKDEIYFLTPDRAIIENNNLEDFHLKDIIIDKIEEHNIYAIDKLYRPKFIVIEHLNLLREQASSGAINWYEQTEFFKKVEDFAGFEISEALKNELMGVYDPQNENKANDKEFINKYIILLLKKDDAFNRSANQKNYM